MLALKSPALQSSVPLLPPTCRRVVQRVGSARTACRSRHASVVYAISGGGEGEEVSRTLDNFLRDAPTVAGASGIAFLLVNRFAAGEALVTAASSAQSRADVLVIAMCAAMVLTGLSWKALKPKPAVTVVLEGEDCLFLHPALPPAAAAELRWVWDAVRSCTRCDACVVYHRGRRVMQAGAAPQALARSQGLAAPAAGEVCAGCMSGGVGTYFPKLAQFPCRFEFYEFLPSNTQGVAVQPIGSAGVLVLGSGTQRGFTSADQSWFALIAQKLDNTLDVLELN